MNCLSSQTIFYSHFWNKYFFQMLKLHRNRYEIDKKSYELCCHIKEFICVMISVKELKIWIKNTVSHSHTRCVFFVLLTSCGDNLKCFCACAFINTLKIVDYVSLNTIHQCCYWLNTANRIVFRELGISAKPAIYRRLVTNI